MSDDLDSQHKQINKSLGFVQLAIAASAVVLVLLVYNFQNMGAYEDMAAKVREQMFKSPEVDAVLLTYRDMGDIVQLKVNVKGVSGELASYRSDALAFVCGNEVLFSQLSDDKSIELDIVATRRKDDKYLKLMISSALCNGLR